MTRENELQDLRHDAENAVSQLHFTLEYFRKNYGEVVDTKSSDEEKLYCYCNTMKHLIMETYEKLVKIENGADALCRGE